MLSYLVLRLKGRTS